jgi:exopolysaccharide biosynthesis predicted pyruvyltransferase EpsI
MTDTRYALRSEDGLYVFRLDKYTNPAATENEAEAKTWASKRGATDAARRANLTNVTPVAVAR